MKKLMLTSRVQKRVAGVLIVLTLLFAPRLSAQITNTFGAHNHNVQNNGTVKWILNPDNMVSKETQRWETIQSVQISQQEDFSDAFKTLPPVKLNLDQVRNGSATSPVLPPTAAPWVNGNAGASNAHYAEGWSIPYRCVIENLVGTGQRSIDIEWDIRQSNASAIDFITNYDVLDYPAGSHVNSFGHSQEVINPISSELGSVSQGTSVDILAPTLPAGAVTTYYNALMATTFPGDATKNAKKLTVYGANVTGMSYISEGSTGAANSSTSLRIFFTNTGPTVILSWGGHIAKGPGVWGDNNSAAAVSGSPYHTRIIQWDADATTPLTQTSVGNQDRSLSADAVLDPPMCELGGPTSVECSAVTTFTSGVGATDDLGSGNTFEWSITNNSNTCTATIIDGTHQDYVTVSNGSGCGCSYTIRYTLKKTTGAELSHCDKNVTVNDATAPLITCPSDVNLACGASTGTANTGRATATDNCGNATVSFTDASVASNCTGQQGINRTWKAQDACGNTATCLQQIRFVDETAPLITCPSNANLACGASTSTANTGVATATDNCGNVSVTFTDASVASNCTGQQGIDRTWKAQDGCGNTATCLQTIRFVDNTAPLITCPSNINLQCGTTTSTDNTGVATATDNCGATPAITYTDAAVAANCTGQAGVNRTWKAQDGCGNTATCLQQIRYVDNTAPLITCPADIIVECSVNATDLGVTGSATATDNCGPVTPTYTDNTDERGCVTYIIRTWKATDACGNSATCVQNITKRDRTGPVINCTNGTATDNCSPQGDITIYFNNGKWTAIDGSGNITTATANCSDQGSVSRSAPTTTLTEETIQEQKVIEEKTVAPVAVKPVLRNDITVQAIPNPFNDRVKFVINNPEAGSGTLEIYNMTGQKIRTVHQGYIPAGVSNFNITFSTRQTANLIYVLRIGDRKQTGKLLQLNAN